MKADADHGLVSSPAGGAAGFFRKFLQHRFEFRVGLGAQVERLLIMIAGEFHLRVAQFGINDGEIEVRVGILRVDLDSAPGFPIRPMAPQPFSLSTMPR